MRTSALLLAGAALTILALVLFPAAPISGAPAFVANDDAVCPRDDEPKYEGVNGCKKCHFKQWMSWKKTPMAKAFDTLKPGQAEEAKKKHNIDVAKDFTKDAACVACHTTGYGLPGGYPAIVEGKAWTEEETKRAAELEGVQCEACHGPGSLTSVYKKDNEQYVKAEVTKRGLTEPDAKSCSRCHNEKSPTVAKDQKLDYDTVIKDPKKIHEHQALKFKH